MSFSFKVTKEGKDTQARLGEMQTAHGVVKTPVFMPVGTVGTVKAMRLDELATMGAEIVLGNCYHLYLRPGHKNIERLGGLHKFMNWNKPILTDSGGFQVFSLGRDPEKRQLGRDAEVNGRRPNKLAKVSENGVEFLSHIDGQKHFMTPELSIEVQEALGADIMMVFDECTPFPATVSEAKASMELSLKWEERSLKAKTKEELALFAIIQGGLYPKVRQECFDQLMEINEKSQGDKFAGFAFGGLSVGEPIPEMYELVDKCAPIVPSKYPRYLMGVGMPEDLVTCIDSGIDMFDCVIPTRNARNGMLFTQTGFIYITQAQYAEDPNPIDSTCTCYTCQNYSRAYLRHLHLAKEIMSSILSTIHNLQYYLNLIGDIRQSLENDTFQQFKKDFFSNRNH